jgi:hypothetical protein
MKYKLKLIVTILLACLGSFNIGIYTVYTKYSIVTSVSPNGEVEIYRWILTTFFVIFFITISVMEISKKK